MDQVLLYACRRAETEADTIGMQLAAKACYDPAAAGKSVLTNVAWLLQYLVSPEISLSVILRSEKRLSSNLYGACVTQLHTSHSKDCKLSHQKCFSACRRPLSHP